VYLHVTAISTEAYPPRPLSSLPNRQLITRFPRPANLGMLRDTIEFFISCTSKDQQTTDAASADMNVRFAMVALCNFSAFPELRRVLVTAGAVPVLVTMSSSDQHKLRADAVCALTNLTCGEVGGGRDTVEKMVEEGVVLALINVAMVRSASDTETRKICALALNNILTATQGMLDVTIIDEIIWMMTDLCEIGVDMRQMFSTICCNLSGLEEGREEIVRVKTFKRLIAYSSSDPVRGGTSLDGNQDGEDSATEEGAAVTAAPEGLGERLRMEAVEESIQEACTGALANMVNLSGDDKTVQMADLVSQGILPVLCGLVQSLEKCPLHVRDMCPLPLVEIASHPGTSSAFVEQGGLIALVSLFDSDVNVGKDGTDSKENEGKDGKEGKEAKEEKGDAEMENEAPPPRLSPETFRQLYSHAPRAILAMAYATPNRAIQDGVLKIAGRVAQKACSAEETKTGNTKTGELLQTVMHIALALQEFAVCSSKGGAQDGHQNADSSTEPTDGWPSGGKGSSVVHRGIVEILSTLTKILVGPTERPFTMAERSSRSHPLVEILLRTLAILSFDLPNRAEMVRRGAIKVLVQLVDVIEASPNMVRLRLRRREVRARVGRPSDGINPTDETAACLLHGFMC